MRPPPDVHYESYCGSSTNYMINMEAQQSEPEQAKCDSTRSGAEWDDYIRGVGCWLSKMKYLLIYINIIYTPKIVNSKTNIETHLKFKIPKALVN